MSDPFNDIVQGMHDSATGSGPGQAPVSPQLPSTRHPLYSPQLMVSLMVDNPGWQHADFAAYFGRSLGWFASVLASQAFQDALEPSRHLIVDPSLTASMEERFRALALRSVGVLQDKLESPNVQEFLVLKAAEIGVKALGLGSRPADVPALPSPKNSSESVADKIMAAMDARDRARTVDVETVEVKEVPDVERAAD